MVLSPWKNKFRQSKILSQFFLATGKILHPKALSRWNFENIAAKIFFRITIAFSLIQWTGSNPRPPPLPGIPQPLPRLPAFPPSPENRCQWPSRVRAKSRRRNLPRSSSSADSSEGEICNVSGAVGNAESRCARLAGSIRSSECVHTYLSTCLLSCVCQKESLDDHFVRIPCVQTWKVKLKVTCCIKNFLANLTDWLCWFSTYLITTTNHTAHWPLPATYRSETCGGQMSDGVLFCAFGGVSADAAVQLSHHLHLGPSLVQRRYVEVRLGRVLYRKNL